MKFLSQVVWSEGMYLAPQHFQVQSRYFEDSIGFVAGNLWRQPWGVLHLEMDTKAIANGTVSLLHASGLFPDGLAFDMPVSDTLPASRPAASLVDASQAAVLLFLAIRARATDALDSAAHAPSLRFSPVTRTLRDETNGVDEHDVELARKNIRVVTAAEITADQICLPIARLLRSPNGSFAYDPEFVPCCLHVSASDPLSLLIRRLLDGIAEKSRTITRPARAGGELAIDSPPLEIANYWFLHALHSTMPVLSHLLHTRHAHPAECYLELSRLAGALCTFALHSDPHDLPAYDHTDPGPPFRALSAHILRHLEIIVPSNTVELTFTSMAPFLHSAPVTDERCLRRSRWILGLRSTIGDSDLLRLAPRLIKVCSERFVPELVKRALPGLSLTHLPVPPAALRTSADMHYFAVDQAGACWQHILQTHAVGIYIPGEIADPEFTLTVVLEGVA